MAFAVVDTGANTIASARMDGAHARILRHSLRKAYTAATMCRHTLSFARDLKERGGALDQWGDIDLTTLPAVWWCSGATRSWARLARAAAVRTMRRLRGSWLRRMGFAVVEDNRAPQTKR